MNVIIVITNAFGRAILAMAAITLCLSPASGDADDADVPRRPTTAEIPAEAHPAVVASEIELATTTLRNPPEYVPPIPTISLSGTFPLTAHGCNGTRCFENSAQVIAPGVNPACPAGRIVLSKGQDNVRLHAGHEDRTVWLRNLTDSSGGFDAGATPVEVALPDTPETVTGTDNLLLKLADGSLLMIRQSVVWEPVSPKPEWWDHVTIQGRPAGARVAQLVFHSTDCGSTWTRISMIDPARFSGQRYAVPRPGECSAKARWDQSQSELGAAEGPAGWESHQLTTLDAYVPDGQQNARFNVSATKTGWLPISKPRQWCAGWAREDFIRNNEQLHRDGFRLVRLNAFMLPIPDGERVNAIWEKTTEERPWILGYTRPDLERKILELHNQGYRLIELNATMFPGADGERFNAIWEKSADDRPWVLGWARADLERHHRELLGRGYRLKALNAYVLPIPDGERFNAVWEKTADNRVAVWGWAKQDLERRHRQLQAAGFELTDLNGYALPLGQGERFNAIWTEHGRGGCFGGWDRPDAYVDPWNGNIFVSMYAVGGPEVNYETWDEVSPAQGANLVFVSQDGARSWRLLTERNAWTPMVMTTTPNGRFLMFTVRDTIPEVHYTLLGLRPALVFKTAEVYYSEIRNGVRVNLDSTVDKLFSDFVNKHTNSISRVSTDEGPSKVRISYSFTENGKSGVAVVLVEIPDDATPPKITPLTKFYASDPSRSILSSTFVEPDIAAARDGDNTALFYWVEGAGERLNAFARFSVFRGESPGTEPSDLGGPWNPLYHGGHYAYSGSYRSRDGKLSFLTHWVEPGAITANIVAVPRLPSVRPPR